MNTEIRASTATNHRASDKHQKIREQKTVSPTTNQVKGQQKVVRNTMNNFSFHTATGMLTKQEIRVLGLRHRFETL
jgi:hypothetical protein